MAALWQQRNKIWQKYLKRTETKAGVVTQKKWYIDKQKRAKPNSSRNHNTDESDIRVAKLKQEIQRKHTEQEASKAEIIKRVEENGEINQELEVKSSKKSMK